MKILKISFPTFIYVTHPITYSMITTCPSHRVKQLVCEANCSLQSSAKVKNEWSCTSAFPCVFMLCRGTALPLPVTVASKLNYAIRPIEAYIFHIRPNFHFPFTKYVVLLMHLIRISPPPPPCGDHFLIIFPSFVQHIHTISLLCFLLFLSRIRQLHFFPYCFRSHSVFFCSVCLSVVTFHPHTT